MYHLAFRQAALRVYEYFGSMRKAAHVCSVSCASLSRWLKRLDPLPRKGRPKLSDAIVASVAVFMGEATRFSSLEVQKFLRDRWGIQASRQFAHCIIRRLGFTFKRTRKRGGGEVIRRNTRAFLEAFRAATRDGAAVVAVDESGFDQRCRPVYAYSRSGIPAVVEVPPCKDRVHYNLLMALHPAGTASWTLRCSTTTGDAFADFVRRLPYPPSTTLLLDNHRIHRTANVMQAVQQKGFRLLFTPPYSPEFNPIELIFGNVKRAFYKARYSSSFGDDVERAIDRCVRAEATPRAIRGSFQHVARLVERAAAAAQLSVEASRA